jgi:predicted esterase
MMLPRREFVRAAGGALLALAGCGSPTEPGPASPRLTARPRPPTKPVTPGQLITVDLPNPYGSALYLPTSYQPAVPIPFLLGLHGAGGSANGQLAFMRPLAEQYGFAFLAVSSRSTTWDVVTTEFGPDIAFIDRALEFAFQRCNADPTRLGVEGFSDGASYTLALAVVNGDLFRRAIAFSPGFFPAFDEAVNGDPEFFFSHGRQDTVLPIDCGTRRLAGWLEVDNYRVVVNEFDGVHEVPAEIAQLAAQWLVEQRVVPPPVQHQFVSPGPIPCIPRPH